MDLFNAWLKVKVVAKAWPTHVAVASSVALIVVDELTKVLGADHAAVTVAVRVAAALGVAVAIVRRSTPVLPSARGVLPQGGPATNTERLLVDEIHRLRDVIKVGG